MMENLLHEIVVGKSSCGVSYKHYGGRDTNLNAENEPL
jgi:hypothetical protein